VIGGASTVERAYQLAEAGECGSLTEIKKRLRKEGFTEVEAQFTSRTFTNDLRRLIHTVRQDA
jgi:hypothetical protein